MSEHGEASAENDAEMESFKAETLVFQMKFGIMAVMTVTLMTLTKMEFKTAVVQLAGSSLATHALDKTEKLLFAILTWLEQRYAALQICIAVMPSKLLFAGTIN